MELKNLKKVLIISSGQPSLNPRLVKEADVLSDAGHDVTVLYAYWNEWGTLHDKQLFSEKKWNAICIGGSPGQNSLTWFLSRVIHKTARYILEKTGIFNYLADIAIARSSFFLIRAAKKYKADIYIAHNLGALTATVKAARRYKKPCGFDAEDFHRHEISDDINSFHFKLCKFLEDKYLPFVNYLTASSPLIAENYAQLYKRKVTSILNVFPKLAFDINIINNKNGPINLFWFSQTIGPKRGLEMVIKAMGLTTFVCELHLLGSSDEGYERQLLELAQMSGVQNERIHFYAPVNANEIFILAAQFDIGLAPEMGFSLNNKIALGNKVFTYLQSGLAVIASNIPSHSAFLAQYSETGKTFSDVNDLAAILTAYNEDRELLYQTKKNAFTIGQTQLNWEKESKKFLKVINDTLTS
ncbi:MAG: hypothetical protein JWP44_3647 [Mucilaginibacter sp.]|nr:hypothetical protein [Mucilaginibacter sp.]